MGILVVSPCEIYIRVYFSKLAERFKAHYGIIQTNRQLLVIYIVNNIAIVFYFLNMIHLSIEAASIIRYMINQGDDYQNYSFFSYFIDPLYEIYSIFQVATDTLLIFSVIRFIHCMGDNSNVQNSLQDNKNTFISGSLTDSREFLNKSFTSSNNAPNNAIQNLNNSNQDLPTFNSVNLINFHGEESIKRTTLTPSSKKKQVLYTQKSTVY